MRPFAYVRARTIPEAIHASQDGGGHGRFVAGGTTLYDLMKLKVETPGRVIDIGGIAELTAFDTSGRHELVFGSLARMSDVAEDQRLLQAYPALAESLAKAASQQLRNMATLGGNLLQRTRCAYFRGGEPFACNKRVPGSGCAAQEGLNRGHAILGGSAACIATFPGDWPVALVALDAVVDLVGPAGQRTLPVEQLYRDPGTTPHIETVLRQRELIARIRVPASPVGRGSTYHKIRDRESYAFALTSAAVAISMRGDVVSDARIALGGVATRPWRAREAEKSLVGGRLDAGTALAAGELAYAGARTTAHNRFKVALGARAVADALMIARQRAGTP